MNHPTRYAKPDLLGLIIGVSLVVTGSVMLFGTGSVAYFGCTAFTPPPTAATTQPTPQSVNVYYLDRGGYITALQAGVIGRLSGKVSDKSARDLELWRTVYVTSVLKPAELAAEPFVNANEWTRLITEQMAVEAQWSVLVPKT